MSDTTNTIMSLPPKKIGDRIVNEIGFAIFFLILLIIMGGIFYCMDKLGVK